MKKIVLKRGITTTQIEGDFPWSKVRNGLGYKMKGYQFSPAFRNGWDGVISFVTRKGVIPAGLTSRAVELFKSLKYDVSVQDTYTPPPTFKKKNIARDLVGMKPRRYQLEATWNAVNKRQGVIKLPTGSGKTVIAILIIKTLRLRTVFLTNRSEIMYQTYKRFCKEFGEDKVGLIGDGRRKYGSLVTITMVQTLVKLVPEELVRVLGVDVFIGDEIHHAKAKTWKGTIKKCPAVYRIGLTATPGDAGELMELEAVTGPIMYDAKVDDLAKEGFLTKPSTIVMSRLTSPEISNRYDYHQTFKRGIVENTRRNSRIISICRVLVSKGRGPVLVFSTSIPHLRKLADLASEKGINYDLLSGRDTSQARARVIEGVDGGHIDVLFVSTIFDEGVDIPNIGSVVMAAVGKSKTKVIQRIGRGMRVAQGKKGFTIVDFWDDTCKYLLNHSKRRRSIYKGEGYPVHVGSLKQYLARNNDL